MEKILYHGSYLKIEYPEIRKHKFTKDFSWGFYCTEIEEQAQKWATKFKEPIVNKYKLKNIEDLNVKIFNDYSHEWLDFVVNCRNGNTHSYDVVEGPMADDTIYEYLEAYLNNMMDEEEFFKLMKFKYPTHQISFHTIRALDHIEFIGSYKLDK
ncbi:DUF3990 domain-containing protein [Romboutsia sp. MSSM.1001216sp_RTP31141st1_G3_RTP31141_220114]|uniref:DUF3990 domain-containing protein n=1 Tax=unclassified Romboutsia TaxID=2626894 RepID=UPI0031B60971